MLGVFGVLTSLAICSLNALACAGGDEEFIFTGRLDNLAMSYLALRALADGYGGESGTTALDQEPAVKAIALFDHEECGSASAQGAVRGLLQLLWCHLMQSVLYVWAQGWTYMISRLYWLSLAHAC